MTFTILNRKKQFLGYAFDVAQVEVRLPDGRERQYDLVDHYNSVTILPVDEKGRSILLLNSGSLLRLSSSNCPPAFWSRVNRP